MSTLLKVGVLRGGMGREYPLSMQSGEEVLRHIDRSRFEPVDILIDREGVWHKEGLPVKPHEILPSFDAVWNSLHGYYGEDGKAQELLTRFGIPFNGSETFPSTLGLNKHATRQFLRDLGVLFPRYFMVRKGDEYEKIAVHVWRSFPQPSIVKPLSGSSSIGLVYADSYHALLDAIQRIIAEGDDVLIEEYIKGKEVAVPVIESYRGEKHYVPMPVHILKDGPVYLPWEKKNNNYRAATYLNEGEKKTLREAARKVHDTLSLRHYSSSDFIVTPKGIYFLEVDTLPTMGRDSVLPFSLSSAGVSMRDFISHVISLSVNK